MKSFEDIYATVVNENKDLENKYYKTKNSDRKLSNYVNVITLILSIILLVIVFVTKFYPLIFISAIGLFILRLILKAILEAVTGVSKEKNNLNKVYKQNIIKLLINNFINNSEYFSEKEMPKYLYDESSFHEYDKKLFVHDDIDFGFKNLDNNDNIFNYNKMLRNRAYDEYFSEDYIEGSIKNNSIQIANVKTEHIYYDDENNKKNKTLFSGIYAKICLDKKFDNNIKIISADFESIENKVVLDYPLFEKYFNVSSSDKIKTLQFLTADVMDYIVELRNKLNMNFDINITNDCIYVRIHCDNVFDLDNYKKDLFDKDILYKNYLILETLDTIVDIVTK